MRKYLDRGAAETAAVDDAGVVQLVGNDDVVSRQNRGDGPGIRGKAALEDHDSFDLLEFRETPLEFHMDRHGPGDRPDRTGPYSERLKCLECPLPEAGMGREAELIVRRQVDY